MTRPATRIAIIGPVHPFRGGIAHHTTLLAQASTTLGGAVSVWSFRRLYPRWLYPGSSDRDPSAVPLTFPAHYTLDSLSPLSAWRTAQAIRQWSAQVVVIPWWTTFLAPSLGLVARWVQPAPIWLVHNVLPHEPRPWDVLLTRWAWHTARAVLAQTPAESTRALTVRPDVPVHVHPHPVYTMFAQQQAERATARQQLGLPAEAPVLLFFGLVRPYKGLRVLLHALASPALAQHQVHLLVAGEFWENVAEYHALLAELGLQQRVVIHNRYIPNEQVGHYFAAADVFVAPYSGGTQSGAVNMALGFGLPVVTSLASAPASPHVRLCPPNDPAALAAAVAEALQHPVPPASPIAPATWHTLAQAVLRLGGFPHA